MLQNLLEYLLFALLFIIWLVLFCFHGNIWHKQALNLIGWISSQQGIFPNNNEDKTHHVLIFVDVLLILDFMIDNIIFHVLKKKNFFFFTIFDCTCFILFINSTCWFGGSDLLLNKCYPVIITNFGFPTWCK